MNLVNNDFIRRMQKELATNQNKGDWSEWKPDLVLLDSEMRYHYEKLIDAVQKNDVEKVEEHSADVANYAMKFYEVFGR